ncbi:hypothetical protein EsH8_III_001543 [Colletotrichum jinshuiense]
MFQPQPTPFASSFHAPPPYSYPHGHGQSYSHSHGPRSQHASSQHDGGYGMSVGAGGSGEMMGEDGGVVAMRMSGGDAEMANYSYSPTPLAAGAGAGAGAGAASSSADVSSCVGMELAPAGQGHSMGSPLALDSLGLGGLGMSMGMAAPSASVLQSRSQSLSLVGGEAAGRRAAHGPPAAAAAAAAAASGASTAHPGQQHHHHQRQQLHHHHQHHRQHPQAPTRTAAATATTAAATTPGSDLRLGPGPGPRPGPGPGLAPASRSALEAPRGALPPGNGLYSPSPSSSTSSPSPATVAVTAASSGAPPTVAAAAHFHHSPGASSATTSSSHSHSHSHSHRHPGASSSSSIASSSFYDSNSYAAAPSTAHSVSTRPSTMEPGDPSDLAAQEAAARDYQPQLEGPLVGDKITSDAITDEYAKADDVYVAKTINIPQTYSHYRPVQGDGNCGWRAIGFSYFEHLVNHGDQNQILGEVARITSLNQYLLSVGGYDRMLFEDMVDETIGLLRDLAQNIANSQLAMHILVQRFNDQDSSNAIIYHLRLLASSWLKGNADVYEPFIPGETGIAGYCGEIERPNREIEHLGIILLVQVLLKPINFVLEIAYLDRSAGSQVNIYRFPDEANGQDPANLGPIIYLLYRPDHYDILYKSPPNPAPLNLQVNRATSFTHRHEIASVPSSLQGYASLDYGPLAMLPGFGGPAPGLSSALSSLGSPSSASPLPDAYDAPSQSSWMSTPYSDHLQQQPVSAPQPQPQAPPPPQQSTPASAKPSQPVDYQLRFSHQCWHLNNANSAQPSMMSGPPGFSEPSFTTAMFKNSHFNKAHYNNPQFHPEEWTPDDDGHHERVTTTKRKGKLRSDH